MPSWEFHAANIYFCNLHHWRHTHRLHVRSWNLWGISPKPHEHESDARWTTLADGKNVYTKFNEWEVFFSENSRQRGLRMKRSSHRILLMKFSSDSAGIIFIDSPPKEVVRTDCELTFSGVIGKVPFAIKDGKVNSFKVMKLTHQKQRVASHCLWLQSLVKVFIKILDEVSTVTSSAAAVAKRLEGIWGRN